MRNSFTLRISELFYQILEILLYVINCAFEVLRKNQLFQIFMKNRDESFATISLGQNIDTISE